MSEIHEEIIKAKKKLYGKTKKFPRAIRLNSKTYSEVQSSICYVRAARTKLIESLQGMTVVLDEREPYFTLEDLYNPMEESDESTDN